MLNRRTDIRLRACPMCGGTPVVLIVRQDGENTLHIQCTTCGVGTPGFRCATGTRAASSEEMLPDLGTARRRAAEAWNRRADEPA